MSSSDPLIHLSEVKKVFYTDEVETHALSGIHLDIQKGEYLSVAGPSGCGKSTLLSILGLLDTPTDGEYVLNEQAVENLSLSERARIRNREVGFVFQSFNLSRVAADLARRKFEREKETGNRSAGARGHGASGEAFTKPTFGRSTTARGGGARGLRPTKHPASR